MIKSFLYFFIKWIFGGFKKEEKKMEEKIF